MSSVQRIKSLIECKKKISQISFIFYFVFYSFRVNYQKPNVFNEFSGNFFFNKPSDIYHIWAIESQISHSQEIQKKKPQANVVEGFYPIPQVFRHYQSAPRPGAPPGRKSGVSTTGTTAITGAQGLSGNDEPVSPGGGPAWQPRGGGRGGPTAGCGWPGQLVRRGGFQVRRGTPPPPHQGANPLVKWRAFTHPCLSRRRRLDSPIEDRFERSCQEPGHQPHCDDGLHRVWAQTRQHWAVRHLFRPGFFWRSVTPCRGGSLGGWVGGGCPSDSHSGKKRRSQRK